jgi:hypothetical protein
MGWVVNATSRPLYPRERPVTHCIGAWVVPRAGLDVLGQEKHLLRLSGFQRRTVQTAASWFNWNVLKKINKN